MVGEEKSGREIVDSYFAALMEALATMTKKALDHEQKQAIRRTTDLALGLHAAREIMAAGISERSRAILRSTAAASTCPVCQAAPNEPCLGVMRFQGRWAGKRRPRETFHRERFLSSDQIFPDRSSRSGD
jgi:hypothetical protein